MIWFFRVIRVKKKKKSPSFEDGIFGAGDGNRTRVAGLGSGCSAIELRLHCFHIIAVKSAIVNRFTKFFHRRIKFFTGAWVSRIFLSAAIELECDLATTARVPLTSPRAKRTILCETVSVKRTRISGEPIERSPFTVFG